VRASVGTGSSDMAARQGWSDRADSQRDESGNFRPLLPGTPRSSLSTRILISLLLGLLVLWSTAFAVIFVMPLVFPDWESASFFSSNRVAEREDFDFLQLFIPANPLHSMAETVVPAVVVFSGALGVALIGRDDKSGLMRGFTSLKAALSSIISFVIRMAPVGIFAIAANAAGTISLDALFSHWIMGAEDPVAQPRWSVWRIVLGFGTGSKSGRIDGNSPRERLRTSSNGRRRRAVSVRVGSGRLSPTIASGRAGFEAGSWNTIPERSCEWNGRTAR